jgi:hypothetical protein
VSRLGVRLLAPWTACTAWHACGFCQQSVCQQQTAGSTKGPYDELDNTGTAAC